MRKRVFLAGVAALALIGAACGGSSQASGGGSDGALTGSIFISGSSTVEPISSLVAELFSEENPDVELTVEGPGTGDGFELFCNGETDISDASRPIEQEEIDACAANGIEYTELEIALDGISVLTSTNNTAASCLNGGDLYALVGPESEGFELWSDANGIAAEVDAKAAPYPDAPLEITAPGEESGTYDAFIELSGIPDIALERGLSPREREITALAARVRQLVAEAFDQASSDGAVSEANVTPN
jgi:phosphate transport system substrate-binding protein